MRAVLIERFGVRPRLADVPDPACPPDGVVLRVDATGLCRSDWHAWRGHDPDVRLPHVPGHELAGTVVEVGAEVRRHRVGERVTTPFVCACGRCEPCCAGDEQVCAAQEQPGFTHWGSFAPLVALHHADINLVPLPDEVSAAVGALLGCRFTTAFRAVVQQGAVRPGEWLAVHGCGGLGLSAVMIGAAYGARVVAVDPDPAALEVARDVGADVAVAASGEVAAAVLDVTDGGAHVSIDAVGAVAAYQASVGSLRRRGRHVQVGLLQPGARPELPADLVGRELVLLGSHGLAARHFPEVLAAIVDGRLDPGRLVGERIGLDRAPDALVAMDAGSPLRATVILPA